MGAPNEDSLPFHDVSASEHFKYFRAMREAAGETQIEVSKRLGISQGSISSTELDPSRSIRPATAKKLLAQMEEWSREGRIVAYLSKVKVRSEDSKSKESREQAPAIKKRTTSKTRRHRRGEIESKARAYLLKELLENNSGKSKESLGNEVANLSIETVLWLINDQ